MAPDSALPSPPGRLAASTRRQHPLAAALALLLALLIALAPPAAGAEQPSDDELRSELERLERERAGLSGELSEVEAQRQELSARLQAATDRLAELEAELGRLHNEADVLRAEVAELEALAAAAAEGMRGRVRDLYKDAGSVHIPELLLVTGSPTDVARRTHYTLALTRNDRAELETAAGIGRVLARRRADLEAATTNIREIARQADEARAELDARLAEAGALAEQVRSEIAATDAEGRQITVELDERQRQREEEERRRREAEAAERERQARLAAEAEAERTRQEAPRSNPAPAEAAAPPPPATGGMVCPQDHPRSFSDTWGAPRSGGRRHRGTDIFGARGGNVFAITDGTVVSTRSGSLSGLFLTLRGDDGHSYWYMHLQEFTASPGQRVSAGELIALNGDTGNARGTTPHIHFEWHPGGGGAVNPYPLLREVCG